MREIVGARIGSIITNSRQTILCALQDNAGIEWMDRDRMQFMSACDLGINWDKMATGPTLFLIDEDGKAHPVQGKSEIP